MTTISDQEVAQEAQYLADRKQRLRVAIIAVPGLMGLLIALWVQALAGDEFNRVSLLPKSTVLTFAILLIAFASLALLMAYLQTGFKKSAEVEALKYKRKAEARRTSEHVALIEHEVTWRAELQRAFDEIDAIKALARTINDGDKSALVAELMKRINTEASATVLAEIETQVAASYSKDSREKELLLSFDESRARLTKELEALGRRGNLNLALGIVTTVTGLGLLGISVYAEITNAAGDLWTFVAHFVPRLSLVVMIELFAYFFLSLYKTSLAEIKYFQNELTNVEAKQISLRAALSFGDQAIVGDILSKMASTERNHILTKHQTTVELEERKHEMDTSGIVAKYVLELLQKRT